MSRFVRRATIGTAIAVAAALAIPTTAAFADTPVAPPGNHAPVAYAQSVAAYQNYPTAILLNGDDPDTKDGKDGITYEVVSGPSHGTLDKDGVALYRYKPTGVYTGPDSFTFRVVDSFGVPSPVVTVTISVVAPTVANRPPTVDNQSIATALNTAVPITLTGADQDKDELKFTLLSSPQHGDLSGTTPNLVYTPANGYTGPDSFTFKASDGKLQSGLGTITIAVNKPNTAPIANSLSATTVQNKSVQLTLTGSDPDGDAFVFNTPTKPAHGTLSGTAPNLVYTPDKWFHGLDTFTFTVTDSHGAVSAPATVSIVVRGYKHRPIAYDQSVATGKNQPVKIHLNGWSGDNDDLDFIVVDGPDHGKLLQKGDDVIYIPYKFFKGYDEFDFVVRDEDGRTSRPATVSIKVKSYWGGYNHH